LYFIHVFLRSDFSTTRPSSSPRMGAPGFISKFLVFFFLHCPLHDFSCCCPYLGRVFLAVNVKTTDCWMPVCSLLDVL
jgi:hypothetical protein